MTPPPKLSSLPDDAKQVLLAKIEGYQNIAGNYGHIRGASGWLEWEKLPPYLTSLDAIAAIEAKLTDEQWHDYRQHLERITFSHHASIVQNKRAFASAKAGEKCEAILLALGKAML